MRLGPNVESIKTVDAYSPKQEIIDLLKVSKSLFFESDFRASFRACSRPLPASIAIPYILFLWSKILISCLLTY